MIHLNFELQSPFSRLCCIINLLENKFFFELSLLVQLSKGKNTTLESMGHTEWKKMEQQLTSHPAS